MILHPSCFSITARGPDLSVDQTYLNRMMAGTPFRRFSHASAVTLQSEKLSYRKLTIGVLLMRMYFSISAPGTEVIPQIWHIRGENAQEVCYQPRFNTSAARALSNIIDVTHSWGHSNTCVCIWLAYCHINFSSLQQSLTVNCQELLIQGSDKGFCKRFPSLCLTTHLLLLQRMQIPSLSCAFQS